MAHNLDFSTGKPAMAYVGKEPWHGLGKKLKPDTTIEEWIKAARLDWEILQEPVSYRFKRKILTVPGRQVLFRSDTGTPLSVVSDSYCIFQPKEVIEFYRDLVAGSDFSLETAGALDEGRKVWGLARSNRTYDKDPMNAFLLLASSCDKTLATTVAFTSIRVVCQNTLSFAMDNVKGEAPTKYLKVAHDKHFDWDEAKKKLDLIDDAWGNFTKKIELLAARKLEQGDASRYFQSLFMSGKKANDETLLTRSALMEIQNLKSALVNGPGQQELFTKDTAWGLVNAVTHYVDHKRGSNNQGQRLDSAWFGSGALLKDKAWESAAKMFLAA